MRWFPLRSRAVSHAARALMLASLVLLEPRPVVADSGAPTNDDFARAEIVSTATTLTYTGTTLGATREPDEPLHAGIETGGSVWWAWTPESSGSVEIHFGAPVPMLVAAVYRGDSLPSLEPVAGRQIVAFRGFQSETFNTLICPVVGGVTHWIALAGLPGVGGRVEFTLRLLPGTAPEHDAFAKRVPLEGLTNRLTGRAVFATEEPGEPLPDIRRRTLWYEWTVPVSGRLRFEVPAGTGESPSFWRGAGLQSLIRLPVPWQGQSLVAGERLVIAVNRAGLSPTSFPPGWIEPTFDIGVGVDPSPVVSVPAHPVAVSPGTELRIDATVAGADPVAFQWFRDVEPVDQANTGTLRIPAVTSGDAGPYRLTASNAFGSVTSSPVTVTIRGPGAAGIDGLPATVRLVEGEPFQLGPATVSGNPEPALRWERLGSDGQWIPIPNANGASLSWTVADWEDSGTYRLTASNSVAVETFSTAVEVTVGNPAPRILAQPRFLNILSGAPVDVPVLLPARTGAVFHWRTNGVAVEGQVLSTVFLGLLPPGTELTLDATVSNAAGVAVVDPFPVRVVGTNLYLETFPDGKRGAEWGASSMAPMPRHGVAEMMLKALSAAATVPGSSAPVAVGYDLWARSSWDGDHGQWGVDRFTVLANGVELVTASVSNNDGLVAARFQPRYLALQPYPGALGQGAFDPGTGSLGRDPFILDSLNRPSLYRFRHRLDALPEPSRLEFQIRGLTDEAAAITRIHVTQLPAHLAWIEPEGQARFTAENDGTLEISLRRSGNLDVPVDVQFRALDQSAMEGRDFILSPGTVRFDPGATRATFPVTLLDNAQPNRVRSFAVWLTDAGTNGLFTAPPFIGVSIADDESRLFLTAPTNRIPEGTRGVVAEIRREGDLTLSRSLRMLVEARGRFPSSDLSGWMGGPNVLTNSIFVHFPAGQAVAQPADSSSFPSFAPSALHTLPGLNLLAAQDTEPEAPNPYLLWLVEPHDLVRHMTAPEMPLRFTVEDDDLTDSLRRARLNRASDNGTTTWTLSAPFTPRRLRIVAESSEDLRTWTEVGPLNSAGRLPLPAPDAVGLFYRLRFLP